MVNIPVRFKRVAAAFDEVAKVRSCDSSGSEHSPEDLSDLLNSFHEREIREQRENEKFDEKDIDGDLEINSNHVSESNNSQDLEIRDSLEKLFDLGNDDVKLRIYEEVEKSLREVSGLAPDFKRRLMARLRDRGFEAGLCKSKWEKNGRCTAGEYEYIDINANETRYIIEVSLAGEFTIARPTSSYTTLLDVFPRIFVGKPDELNQVVRLMCRAIRKSMKGVDIHVPPWRRLAYLQAKWFGSYKRTTNEVSSRKVEIFGGDVAKNKSVVGFMATVPVAGVSFYCRGDFAAKKGVRRGNLAAAFKQEEVL
ncbi:hypothetical protein ACJIZ3_006692 [Penstemon smallii]|uniref:DUF506 family protein n=1 Tax=Penstemon smallii TaxID=265156 RepID=A0ABD3S8I0_9LAMI